MATSFVWSRIANAFGFFNFNIGWVTENPDRPYSLLRDQRHPSLFHARVYPGELNPGGIAGLRAEIRQVSTIPPGKEHWLSLNHFMRRHTLNTGMTNTIIQCHNTWDAGDQSDNPPPIDIFFDDSGTLNIATANDPNATTTGTIPKVIRKQILPADYVRDVWHNWVIRYTITPTASNGLLQVWLDGVLILDLANLQSGYNDTLGCYWKTGVYSYGFTGVLEAYMANVEFSYDSLFGRIDSPRAVPALT